MRDSAYSEILVLLRRMQQNNRFIVFDNETGLRLIDSAALLEIDTFPGIAANQLADRLKLGKSTIAQAISRLKNLNLVRVAALARDRRQKELSVTSHGALVLSRYDEVSNEMLQDFTRGFSSRDKASFAAVLKCLGDYGCPFPGKLRANDHPIRLEMRRLTIAFGLLARRFRNSRFSLAEWNVMSELAESPGRVSDLVERLSLAQNYVSQIASSLEAGGLLVSRPVPSDKRSHELSLTEDGTRAIREVDADIISQLKESLKKLEPSRLAEFVRLLRLFTISRDSARSTRAEEPLVIKKLNRESELNRCRLLFIEQALKADGIPTIPEQLFPRGSHNFGVFDGNLLVGAIEMSISPSGRTLVREVRTHDRVTPERWDAVMKRVARR